MRSGRQSVPIEIMTRTSQKDDLGGRNRTQALWREVWAEFRAVRGGEMQAGREQIMQSRVEFVVNYAEVMMDQGDGKGVLSADMAISCEGSLYDIVEIMPDLVTRKTVRIGAVSTRLVR